MRPEREKRMTAIIGISVGRGGILCADSQETVYGYSKKSVQKFKTELFNKPFRFAIGAAGPGHYCDLLMGQISSALLKLNEFNQTVISGAITDVLIDFYPKHIWAKPAGERQDVDTLTLIQESQSSQTFLIHTSETAVNWVDDSYKAIGLGCYLAEYLLDILLVPMGGEVHALATAIYVLNQVIENIDGCGKEPQLIAFRRDGNHEIIFNDEFKCAAQDLDQFWSDFRWIFHYITDVGDEQGIAKSPDQIAQDIEDRREKFAEWSHMFKERREKYRNWFGYWGKKNSGGKTA